MAIKTHREKIHTICQRVVHQRDACEPEVPKYSALELAETIPGFDVAIDAFTAKIQKLETAATIQLLRRQPNFKGSYYVNQARAIRHLCYVKEACDKHGRSSKKPSSICWRLQRIAWDSSRPIWKKRWRGWRRTSQNQDK